ncbi:MAG: hypothetical protein M1503_00245 [Thaumarchaeota archaeon]|nr:hypothetical protein [Nitrososphaerota archaeon]MCL5316681.1 hypothetical protein [Nitrososphaerota archaeon]
MAHGSTKIRKGRRGIGTVVATIVFVFILVFTMGQLYVWYLARLDDYNAAVDSMFELDSQRRNENFAISGVSVNPNNTINLTVTNNGGSTVHLVRLWVINETASPNTHALYNVSAYIGSGGMGVVNGSAPYGKKMTLKLVSELGNIVSYRIAPASQIPNLRMTLDASPPSVIGSHDVGVTLFVFNNNTAYNALYALGISPATDISCAYNKTLSCTSVTSLTPPTITTINSIRSGETATFSWTYRTTNPSPGSNLTFKGRYTGASYFANRTVWVVTPFGRDSTVGTPEVFGSIRVQISTFRWSQNNGVTWSAGFSIPQRKYTIWKVNVTNTHLTKSIKLNETSAIAFLQTDRGSFPEFYLIESPTGGPRCHDVCPFDGIDDNAAYPDPIIIAPGQTVTLYFGAQDPRDNQGQRSGSPSGSSFASVIVLLGNYNSNPNDPYGQSIPFLAVRTS